MFISRNLRSLVKFNLDQSTKIGTLTLNSPKKMNALTAEMGDEFTDILKNQIKEAQSFNLNVILNRK